jgi:hypothetical protein
VRWCIPFRRGRSGLSAPFGGGSPAGGVLDKEVALGAGPGHHVSQTKGELTPIVTDGSYQDDDLAR